MTAHFADLELESTKTLAQIQARILEHARRAIRAMNDPTRPQMVRDICTAYLHDVCKRRVEYMRAALRNKSYRDWVDGKVQSFYEFSVESLVVNPPAVWEFEFVEVTGSVNDANWCAGQYRWNRFLGVRPMEPETGWGQVCIAIVHKPNSRFRVGWENRDRLKAMLGRKYRRLVNDARSMSKTEFLAEFHKPAIPRHLQHITMIEQRSGRVLRCGSTGKLVRDISADTLAALTGYTPEEFWREVDFLKRNHGEHVQPFKRDLFEQLLAKPDVVAIIPKQKPKKEKGETP